MLWCLFCRACVGLLLGTLCLLGQGLDGIGRTPEDLKLALKGTPRDAAWAAYEIARQNRSELIPVLSAILSSYRRGAASDPKEMLPEDDAMEAVASALIQLRATLPSEIVMHLYPRFSADTILLLSRSVNSGPSLTNIFLSSQYPELWLAAGNLLTAHPTPEFVSAVLTDVVGIFRFRAVGKSDKSNDEEVQGGCAEDFALGQEVFFQDWPKVRLYGLETGDHLQNIAAAGIHSVGFFSWETTDYVDHSTNNGDCSPDKTVSWRIGLLAQLQGKSLEAFPLHAETEETIVYRSDTSFVHRVKKVLAGQAKEFGKVQRSFLDSGLMSSSDSKRIKLLCRVDIRDDRPQPHGPLPDLEGQWSGKQRDFILR